MRITQTTAFRITHPRTLIAVTIQFTPSNLPSCFYCGAGRGVLVCIQKRCAASLAQMDGIGMSQILSFIAIVSLSGPLLLASPEFTNALPRRKG